MSNDNQENKIDKSSTHSDVTGKLGEYLVLYFLSKYGFEIIHANQVGIDVIASKDSTGVIGIGVVMASKLEGNESEGRTLKGSLYNKIVNTCEKFNCEPWIAIVFDIPGNESGSIKIVLMKLEKFVTKDFYPYFKEGKDINVRSSEKNLERLRSDPDVFNISMNYDKSKWISWKTIKELEYLNEGV